MNANVLSINPAKNASKNSTTSAGVAAQKITDLLAQMLGTLPYCSETASSESILNWRLYAFEPQTASNIAVTFSAPHSTEAPQIAVNELKKLSGLTWDQLGKALNVSRRSLHFWASGKPLNPFNEEHLRHLLSTIRYIDRGSADVNRSALLQPQQNEKTPLDLLIAGKYEEVKRLLGSGKTFEKLSLAPLSSTVSIARRPPSPENLVGALHEPVHKNVGRSRPAKTNRSRRCVKGQ